MFGFRMQLLWESKSIPHIEDVEIKKAMRRVESSDIPDGMDIVRTIGMSILTAIVNAT